MSIERAAKATVSPSQSRSMRQVWYPRHVQPMPSCDVTRRLARWYRVHKRDVPWRRTRDPHAVWISEVMLQQTTVEVIASRWERFLRRFPTVEALARATEREVLAEWSGLGYYARARNLHHAARAIAEAGAFPRTLEGLRALPGIGAYTAAAVGSICFQIREPVVDGNVVRVLCRLHGLRLDSKAPATLANVRALARPLIPARNPGDNNQHVMELGALVCTPRAPRCGARGVHTRAPSSITAWLWSPGFRAGMSGLASARTFASVAGAFESRRRPWRRQRTRTTLPSTTGSGIWKQIDPTAAAVYAPMPGRALRPSSVRGNAPASAMALAAWCRFRARA